MFLLTFFLFFFTHYLSPLLLPGALLVDRFWPQLHQISKCSSPVPHLRGRLNLWLWAWWTSPSNSYDDKAICKITSWLKPCTEEALDCLWIINQLLTNTCTWFTVPMTFFSLIPRSTPAAPSAYALMSFDAKKKLQSDLKITQKNLRYHLTHLSCADVSLPATGALPRQLITASHSATVFLCCVGQTPKSSNVFSQGESSWPTLWRCTNFSQRTTGIN